jgi:hypothetical protein
MGEITHSNKEREVAKRENKISFSAFRHFWESPQKGGRVEVVDATSVILLVRGYLCSCSYNIGADGDLSTAQLRNWRSR